ncbi:MAG: class I SAM-dependent methyltransferase [Cyclobacteriaceae bacterium]|nr:class I SAM-dependent methyltransferase [Cyclobacteriaceae bacterium]
MQFVQQLKTILLFVEYYLKVVDQHSLQAPFVFQFYKNLIQGIKRAKGNDEIESIRKMLLKDHSIVGGQDFGAGTRIQKSSNKRTVASIAKYGISSRKDCIFLSELIKLFQPETCIELGTSLGIETAYLAKSVSIKSLYSFEGNEPLVLKAGQLMRQLDCGHAHIIQGDIDLELPRQLEKIGKLDLAIIDANHTKNAVLRYFSLLKGKMSPNGIIIIDDIRWSVGMYKAWKNIVREECVSLSIEFLNKGVLFFEIGIPKQHYVLSY